jgi:hypothetical protein
MYLFTPYSYSSNVRTSQQLVVVDPCRRDAKLDWVERHWVTYGALIAHCPLHSIGVDAIAAKTTAALCLLLNGVHRQPRTDAAPRDIRPSPGNEENLTQPKPSRVQHHINMAPTRTRKRKSDVSSSSADHRSPIKKRKMGLTLAQKQALIDNLQLERMYYVCGVRGGETRHTFREC